MFTPQHERPFRLILCWKRVGLPDSRICLVQFNHGTWTDVLGCQSPAAALIARSHDVDSTRKSVRYCVNRGSRRKNRQHGKTADSETYNKSKKRSWGRSSVG